MRKSITLSLAMVAALGGSALAFAASGGMEGGHGWHGHHGMHEGMRAYGKLNLSDSQKASIKQMTQQSFATAKPQFEAMRQQRKAFEAMDPTSSGYQTATAKLADEEATATRERVMRRAALRAQIYGVLTPAQRTQLVSMRAQREARHAQWEQFKAQHPVQQSAPTAQ